MSKLTELLKVQEGYRRTPYKCTEGYLTIAYGRNLETNGIDEEEAEYLLTRDIEKCRDSLSTNLDFFDSLSGVRQDALINMTFQIGISGILKFKKMLDHLYNHRYNEAGEEALNSRWAAQTPTRAWQVSKMIKTGRY